MDEVFIQKLKNKEDSAFRELVNTYQNMVFRTCLGIVHDHDDADDVAQEVFIEAFNSIQKFRSDSKISTWLYRIAINKSLNFVRSNKRSKNTIPLEPTQENTLADDDHNFDQPHEKLLEKQRKAIMDAAIDSLPKNQRSAFILNKIEELSYKEISEVLNISVSSVESLLFRAKKNLQKKLISCYKKSC